LTTPIIMVHGAFCGGWVFDAFRKPFEEAGHVVTAPDLVGHEPGAKRQAVAGRSMSEYAGAIAELCASQAEPPIRIGHSLGGLICQLAAAKADLAGMVLLAPSPPWGVHGSSLEEAVSAVSLFALGPYWAMAIDPDYPAARRYLFARLPRADRRSTFARMTAESGRALWETLNWWLDPFATTLVTRASGRAPVLAIAGSLDAIHPAATVEATSRRLGGTTVTLPGMGHWLPAEPGWESVAETCLDWIDGLNARDAA
jgi:pimeloyl-ACP methyl ester carboxylesterase